MWQELDAFGRNRMDVEGLGRTWSELDEKKKKWEDLYEQWLNHQESL